MGVTAGKVRGIAGGGGLALRGGRLGAEVAVVDGFGDADPDIEEADAGDDAADGAVVEDVGEGGAGEDKGVVVPDAGPPGEDEDEDAEVDAEEDEDKEGDALEPDRGEAAEGTTAVGAGPRRAGWGAGSADGRCSCSANGCSPLTLAEGRDCAGRVCRIPHLRVEMWGTLAFVVEKRVSPLRFAAIGTTPW